MKPRQSACVFACSPEDGTMIFVHVYRKYISAFTTFSGLQMMSDTSRMYRV